MRRPRRPTQARPSGRRRARAAPDARPARRWTPHLLALAALAALAVPTLALLPLLRLETADVDVAAARQRLTADPTTADPTAGAARNADGRPSADATAATSSGADEPAGGTPPATPDDASQPAASASTAPPAPAPVRRDDHRTVLLLGSDARPGLGGARADVILLGLLPGDGSAPVLISLPRDLHLPDPCGGGHQRINAALNGCGDVASGLELTAIVVEDFTGLAVDDVVAIDFVGFTRVIDAVGGIEACVDHPTRDDDLDLAAGCSTLDGVQALAWVRSRHTEQLVDGRWRTVPRVSDLTRNQRQQEILLQLLDRVASARTVTRLHELARGLQDAVTIGSDLTLPDAVGLAWQLRDRTDEVRRVSIPVTDATTGADAQVLLPTEPFPATLARARSE